MPKGAVKDEAKWARAKEIARKQKPDNFYALATHIYQQMTKSDRSAAGKTDEQLLAIAALDAEHFGRPDLAKYVFTGLQRQRDTGARQLTGKMLAFSYLDKGTPEHRRNGRSKGSERRFESMSEVTDLLNDWISKASAMGEDKEPSIMQEGEVLANAERSTPPGPKKRPKKQGESGLDLGDPPKTMPSSPRPNVEGDLPGARKSLSGEQMTRIEALQGGRVPHRGDVRFGGPVPGAVMKSLGPNVSIADASFPQNSHGPLTSCETCGVCKSQTPAALSSCQHCGSDRSPKSATFGGNTQIEKSILRALTPPPGDVPFGRG